MDIKKITTKLGRKLSEAGVFWLMLFSPAYAQNIESVNKGITNAQPAGAPTDLTTVVKNIINTLLLLVGMLSVIMLIVGGIRYVVSSGNQDAVQAAKNTIIYALLGLAVAILAYAIVNFIFGQLTTDQTALLRLV